MNTNEQSLAMTRKSMTKYKFFVAVLLIATGLLLMGKSLAVAQNKGEFAVPLTDPNKRAKVKVHLNSGSVTVKGTARKDVLITYEGKSDDNDDDDDDDGNKQGLRKISGGTLDIEATQNENYVVVKSDSWNNEINVVVEVPMSVDLQVQTYNNGDLMVRSIQGVVEMTNYNGEISAENISGSVVATTYNGEIKVSFDKVTENTPMSFSTYNGDIDLTFPATFKASLKMKTEQGDIYTGFDVNLMKSSPVEKKDTKAGTYKVVINEWMKGDINGGGPEITVKNYNGDIYVRKK